METHQQRPCFSAPDWIDQLTNSSYIQSQFRTKFASPALPSKINLARSFNGTICTMQDAVGIVARDCRRSFFGDSCDFRM